jgi:hypothetical protein
MTRANHWLIRGFVLTDTLLVETRRRQNKKRTVIFNDTPVSQPLHPSLV